MLKVNVFGPAPGFASRIAGTRARARGELRFGRFLYNGPLCVFHRYSESMRCIVLVCNGLFDGSPVASGTGVRRRCRWECLHRCPRYIPVCSPSSGESREYVSTVHDLLVDRMAAWLDVTFVANSLATVDKQTSTPHIRG